jgi:DNA-binding CsgD family transcriptional regulator
VSRGNRRTLGLSPQRLASRRFLTSLRTVTLNIAQDDLFYRPQVFPHSSKDHIGIPVLQRVDDLQKLRATLIQDTIHRIADLIVKEYVHHLANAEPSVFSILTPRQLEVLQLLSEGKTTKEIAFSLQVSVKTIETHRQQIMLKLGVHSIAELTKHAIREGLTPVDR